MTLKIARKILRETSDDSVVDFISDNYDAFIWDEYGDELKQWSGIAQKRSLPLVSAEVRDGEATNYCYRGKCVLVPFKNERGDNTIGVHVMGNLVYPDLELRVVVDTIGNSEYAFLPLTPQEWRELENVFGEKAVASRFTPLGTSVDDMLVRAEDAYELRVPQEPDIPTDPSAAPYIALLKSIPTNWQQAADWINLQNNDATIRVDRLSSLVAGFAATAMNVFFASTIVGQRKQGFGLILQQDAVLATILPKIGVGGTDIVLFDESFSRVVVVHGNATACVWVSPES